VNRIRLCVIAVLCCCRALSAATFYGPTPYNSAADSPFDGLGLYLEDFQDGSLNTPGVTANAGIALSGPGGGLVDSVEGPPMWSYYMGSPVLRFTFSALALGGLPTRAGIVWTDVGNNSGPTFGAADVQFEAFDSLGVSLGVIGPFVLGDGSVVENQADDRFFGVFEAGGISAVELRMPLSSDWEVDHLQYGSAIPEPGTAVLVVAGAVAVAASRRFR
jgi:hypothetical protein